MPSSASKYFLLLHPQAQIRHPKDFAKLIACVQDLGVDWRSAEPRDAQDITCLTRQALAEGFTHVLPLGGDGTLSLCAQAFMENGRNLFPDACILPLPFGTGNDFCAGFLGPKNRDFSWLRGNTGLVPISLGRFEKADGGTQYFINSFSTGITTDIVLDYSRSRFRSYLFSTLKTILRYRCLALSIDRRQQKTLVFLISKGAFVGGGMRFHREADHHKGLSKYVWIPKIALGRILRHLVRLYQGGVDAIPDIQSGDFSRLCIRFNKEVNWVEADGELYQVGPEVHLQEIPGIIQVLGPKKT